ncbi:hypothetical protein [Microbispora sp. H13382]|uniref:hypothetical protein n=1 Tax=Microbispora sp. H13382 TaxID=2729112 RepID=UPI0015FFF139|nr:hypothetical protein [Microbispora sp. H13382]
MKALVTRVSTICAAVALAGAVTAAPAAAQDTAAYTCTYGTRILVNDWQGYGILARECTGSGTGVAGTITLETGTYHCHRVVRVTDTEPLYIAGYDC